MKANVFAGCLLAGAIVLAASPAQSATVTAQGPTGALTVSYFDMNGPFTADMLTASGTTSYYPTAKVIGNAVVIDFPAPPGGASGPFIAARDVLQPSISANTRYSGNVSAPLSFSVGANQSSYAIEVDATLISNPGTYGLYSRDLGLTAPQFNFTASIQGTQTDGATTNLLNFSKGVADVSTQNITLSALIPIGTDLSKLRFDFGATFKIVDPLPFAYIKGGASYDGQLVVNSIRIQPLTTAVPEAGTWALMLVGLAGMAGLRLRRQGLMERGQNQAR